MGIMWKTQFLVNLGIESVVLFLRFHFFTLHQHKEILLVALSSFSHKYS